MTQKQVIREAMDEKHLLDLRRKRYLGKSFTKACKLCGSPTSQSRLGLWPANPWVVEPTDLPLLKPDKSIERRELLI